MFMRTFPNPRAGCISLPANPFCIVLLSVLASILGCFTPALAAFLVL